ncbi:MAG: hypothetical protein V1833_05210 [Elusimicrobiota bacterium]
MSWIRYKYKSIATENTEKGTERTQRKSLCTLCFLLYTLRLFAVADFLGAYGSIKHLPRISRIKKKRN